MKKAYLFILTALAILLSLNTIQAKEQVSPDKKIVVAYVTSWSSVMPNPNYMTHINYAFGHVSDSFNGIRIDNEERLRQIVALKKQNPDLKIMLSIGGWGSGHFSEMAADKHLRKAFAQDCKRVVKEFGLDGIDIDWEYPTQSGAEISSSPADTQNYTLLMQDIRKEIGRKKLLTLATVASGQYIDFKAILPVIDFVNIMSYDMGGGSTHHAALFRSPIAGGITCEEAVNAHLKAGVPAHKLTMGLPFYGRGRAPFSNFTDYRQIQITDSCTRKWDDTAQAPYVVDKNGSFVLGYDNPHSLAIKCQYILAKNLLGGMYWDYAGDNESGDLQRTVYEGLIEKRDYKEPFRVLVLTERGGQHGGFSSAGLNWLAHEGDALHFVVTEINHAQPITADFLSKFQLIVQLDFPPYTWPDKAQKAFTDYIDRGLGGWIGFHHATLLGQFDGYPMWNWFSDFMGGIRFKNYIAQLASGSVVVEASTHPVMQGVRTTFTLADDEWYTYDKSPRENVQVLARVDESTYRPASDITMGDHPVIWCNNHKKAKNVYFQMGHSRKLFESDDFTTLFRNALVWCLSK